jgi:hypothetical protein
LLKKPVIAEKAKVRARAKIKSERKARRKIDAKSSNKLEKQRSEKLERQQTKKQKAIHQGQSRRAEPVIKAREKEPEVVRQRRCWSVNEWTKTFSNARKGYRGRESRVPGIRHNGWQPQNRFDRRR